MWMVSLMSSLETSTSMVLGMLSAGQISSMAWRTILSTPPFFRPGELALALEVHRNFQAHGGAFGQAHEIDMHGAVADRVELQLARDHAGLLAADVQHEQGGEEMAGLDMALQGAGVDATFSGSSLAAIDHGGDQALLARLEGRALAGAVARFHLKFLNLRHFPDPSGPAKPARAPERRGF